MIRPISVLVLAMALMLCLLPRAETLEAGPPPNIVLIITDDQRHDALGFRHPVLTTPNMDSLASSGVWFENAFVTTPICSASRATILTGLHESTHHHGFGSAMSMDILAKSYPVLLREAGYFTGFVGKNGTNLDDARQTYLFDQYVEVGLPYLAVRDGEVVHATDFTAAKAVQFIQAQLPERPFLLTVAFNAPHAEDRNPEQFVPPERFRELYQGVDYPEPPLGDPSFFAAQPVFLQELLNRERWHLRWTPDLYDVMMSRYLAMVHTVDSAVGQILQALEESGLADDTVLLFTSDNGFFVGERGYAGKWLAYEPSIRVPLLIRDPRLPAELQGRVVSELALNLDLAETILDLAGVAVPAAMQGRSLLPLVYGERTSWRVDTFLEHHWTSPPDFVIPRHEGLRDDRFKYIRYLDHGREELYDLEADPDEAVDLSTDPQWLSTLQSMRARCLELKALYYVAEIFEDGFESGETDEWSVGP